MIWYLNGDNINLNVFAKETFSENLGKIGKYLLKIIRKGEILLVNSRKKNKKVMIKNF